MTKTENQTDRKAVVLSADTCEVVDLKTACDDILMVIDNYIYNTYGLEDNTKISQGQYNIILMDMYNIYIKPIDLFVHDEGLKYKYKSDGSITILFDLYIKLCMKYKKQVCYYGFSCLCGIDNFTIQGWLHDKKASREKIDIAKNIDYLSQETLKDFLVDGQRNPVGVLAVLNNLHGWSDKRTVITRERQADSLEGIAEKLGVQRLEG